MLSGKQLSTPHPFLAINKQPSTSASKTHYIHHLAPLNFIPRTPKTSLLGR